MVGEGAVDKEVAGAFGEVVIASSLSGKIHLLFCDCLTIYGYHRSIAQI